MKTYSNTIPVSVNAPLKALYLV